MESCANQLAIGESSGRSGSQSNHGVLRRGGGKVEAGQGGGGSWW